MNHADPPGDLTPEEERLLDMLIAYDEALVAGVSPVGSTSAPAELQPGMADQLLRGQRLLELLAALNPSDDARPPAPPVVNEPPLLGVDALWHTLPEDGALPPQLGRFVILRELGRGGHGVVLLAHDPILKRHVALKVPRPENLLSASMRRRFVREAQTAARLTHPNLVSVYEVGEIGPVCYIASAYCPGPTLAEWLATRGTPVSPQLAARVIEQLALALQYAHEQNILHRDLKPSNVLLEPSVRGESAAASANEGRLNFVPKVTDFGLAKFAADSDEGTRTQTGSVLGTPAYMSPEQAEGRLADIGATTDVYALGTILHELLTGLAAFRGGTEIETLHKVLFEEAVPLRRLRRDVPADLEAICRKCMERKIESRYPSCAALAADLRRFLGGRPTLARPLTVPQRLAKWARRRPAVAALVAVSTLAAATIVAGSSLYTVRLGRALADSETRRVEADEHRADADRHRQQAEVNLDLAEKSRQEVIRQQQTTNQFVYGARMHQAYLALAQGDLRNVQELLGDYDPGAPGANLQEFSLRYLRHMVHGERQLRGHVGEVYAVKFSPDGRAVLSGGADGTIRFWDAVSGQLLRTIQAHESCTNDLSFSPDGRFLVSASCDDTLKLWDTSTWNQMATLSAHGGDVLCVAFSPDGRLIASGDTKGLTYIWSLDERCQPIILPSDGDCGAVNAVVWSADDQTLVVGQAKTSIRLFEIGTWKLLSRTKPSGTTTIALSADGRLQATNALNRIEDGEIRDVRSKELLATLTSQFGFIEKVIFSHDARQLFSCDESGLVRIWNLTADGRLDTNVSRNDQQTALSTRTLIGHTGRVQSLALAPNGGTLASASFDGTVRLWDLTARGDSVPMLSCRLRGSGFGSQYRVHLTSDLARLSIFASDMQIVDFDIRSGEQVRSRQLAPWTGHEFLFAPNGRQVITWRYKDTALLASPLDVAEPFEFNIPLCPITKQVVFSANGLRVATAGDDGFVRVRDLADGVERFAFQHGQGTQIAYDAAATRLALSSDGRLLARANIKPGLVDVDIGKRTEFPCLEKGVSGIHFSPDDSMLALRCGNGTIQLLNVAERSVIQRLRLSSPPTHLAFSADNRTLVVATLDGHITLWHTASGQQLASLLSHAGQVALLQFSEDNSALAALIVDSATNEANLHVWSTRD
jgi:WD40 repeat protein